MKTWRPICAFAAIFGFLIAPPLLAQSTTTAAGLSLKDTLGQLIGPAGSPAAAQAIALATSLEVATAPFGNSSGGFVYKLDPSTGLQARTATTFGPAFAERALTSGEGKISVAVNLNASSYSRLGDLSIDQMKVSAIHATSPLVARSGMASLVLSSTTVVFSGTVGVTDALDLGVAVPTVSVKLDGLSWVQNDKGDVLLRATGSGTSAGLGDIAASAKYRFFSFGSGTPDPGGLAVMATVRMPTGDVDNLRGLGVTRTSVSIIGSSGTGRLRPHVNAGYEWWSSGIDISTQLPIQTTATAKDQIQFAAGAEFEAVPKLTLLVDFLGRQIRHGGQVGNQTAIPTSQEAANLGVTSVESLVPLQEGIQKLTLVPGMKLNVKGSLLLSLNVLIALKDTGLHARVTPVAGVDLTF
jgi:hypothetical protein